MSVRKTVTNTPPDMVLFGVTLALLVIGMVTVFSASYATALRDFGDPYYYIKRQLIWAVLGLIALFLMMNIDYRVLRRFALPGLLITIVLLGLVLVIGSEAGGGRRWINLGFLSFQPSELAKVALVNFIAAFVAFQGGKMRRFFQGFLLPMCIAGFIAALILAEKDFGTSAAVGLNALVMLFAGGAQFWHLSLVAVAAVPAMALLIKLEPYRLRRITAFVNPWLDPLDSGWNIIQSLYAIGSGGLFGLGLGAGRQKFAYLPEQHTDFIFAVLAEELGFLGTATVLILFFTFAWRGFRIALAAPDVYGSMMAVGLTSMVTLQALINIGVVTGSMPVTGITLPLVSAGGTSLLVTLAAIGVLLNISRYLGPGGRPS